MTEHRIDGERASGRARGSWAAVHKLFRDASPLTCSHWNVDTGELFSVRSSRRQRGLVEAFEDRLFNEEGWVEVPFLESDDAFGLMREFAAELAPGKARTELLAALDQDKPFRRFRTVLGRRPGIARRWKKLADEEAGMRLAVFCLGQEVEMSGPEFAAAADAVREVWRESDRQEGRVAVSTLSLGRARTLAREA